MGTILLVDDNPLRASMRKSMLEGTVPQVVRALNAAEAFCLIESPEFAPRLILVITENLMQGIAGPDFVKELRERVPSVPVLVLGGTALTQHEYDGVHGVYHSQTRSPQELRAVVKRLLVLGERQYA
jgi:CheY-like chemotaxis protein